MKKLILIFGILFGIVLSAAAESKFYNSLFIIRFLKCLPTNMTFSTTQDGVTLTQQRHILNWHEHMCGYRVVESIDDKSVTYDCKLSRSQVTEFSQAMRNDHDGVGEAKAYWENLKNNPEVCTKQD